MQNLRLTRETELAEVYPLHAVTAWLGNSQLVAAKHYLQLRDELFQRAAEGEPGPQAGPQLHETGETGTKPKNKTHEKTSVFRGSADVFASLPTAGLGDTGLEPPPQNTGETAVYESSSPTSSPTAGTVDLAAALQALAALTPEQLAGLLNLPQATAGK